MAKKILILLLLVGLFQACGPSLTVTASLEELNQAVQEDPNNPVPHFNLGLKYYSDKNFDEAIKNFDLALERDPNFALPYFGKYCAELVKDENFRHQYVLSYDEEAEIEEEYKEKIDDVRNYYSKAFTINPLFDFSMATLLLQKKTHSSNSAEFELINELYKLLLDGIRSYMVGHYEEAAKELDYSISRIPEYERAYFWRSLARAQIGEYDGAIADLDTLIGWTHKTNEENLVTIYYDVADLYFLRGTINIRKNNLKDAEADMKTCLVEDLGFYPAHTQLSYIYQQQKKYQLALAEIEASIFVEKDDPQLYYNKGVFLAMFGKNAEAIEAYEKTVELNKYNFKALYNLAFLNEKIGDTENAKKYYQMFTELAPNSQEKMIAEVKLKLSNWN